MDFILSLSFEESFSLFMFSIIFFTAELTILAYIFIDQRLFFITRDMKKNLRKARWMGKILFFLFGYALMLLELIPNIIAIVGAVIVSFFQYIADKDISYKRCFMRKFDG